MKSIRFENYRQYGTGTIHFDNEKDYMLSAFIAKNGTGKTTFLNAITWCLYGKEYQLSDESAALPLLNTDVQSKMEKYETATVKVSVTIADADKIIEFSRQVMYRLGHNMSLAGGTGDLTVRITQQGKVENSKIYQGSDAKIIVKQYFDEDIYNFYFFDGEKLKDFFEKGKESLKDSIYNISQITLLNTTITHVRKQYKGVQKKASDNSPRLAAALADQETEEQVLNAAISIIETKKEQRKEFDEQLRNIDALLVGYEPISKLQSERIAKEADLANEEIKAVSLKNDTKEFIRKYTVLLKLYPNIKAIKDLIAEKEERGELPPTIDKEQIKALLADPEKPCPLCTSKIDSTARNHLEELLERITVSTKTSNYLKELKGSLEICMDEIESYSEKRQELKLRKNDIEFSMNSISERLREINRILANYDNVSEVDIKGLERQRSELRESIAECDRTIGAQEQTEKNSRERLKDIQSKIELLNKDLAIQVQSKKYMDVYGAVLNNLEVVQKSIVDAMREEVENKTWYYFDSMIWKEQTFGKITIDDKYKINVYDKQGQKMTGSLSATEQMALAYAFTLAIHEASGINCPLIIDSPLGRVSDDNRKKMAQALLDVSKNKQIIMLFTPDEYSEKVQEIYTETAHIRTLKLTADEKYIEGIER